MTPDAAGLWSRAGATVAQRLGLDFPPARIVDLQRGLAAAAADLGLPGGEDCARRLADGALSAAELELVASHLTIGETYFFRGDETFAAMARHVLPALVRAREGGEKRLRLWSAGCCTGEEAYSLAILLRETLPDIDDWNVTILATDLNPRFLRRAAEGVYGEWSFRGMDPALRRRWFTRAGNRHAIDPRIRRMVAFAPLNLAEDVYPALATGTNAMDVVFCRNVLMYFTPAQARRAVAHLRECLVPDGWLVVAPCETSQGLFRDFRSHVLEGAILYRRAAAEASPPRVGAPATIPAHPGATRPRPIAVRAAPPASAAHAPAGHAPAVCAGRARAAASEGRLSDALAWCDRWIAGDKVDAQGHYLRAMVLVEQGDAAEARRALQRCAFLEPDAVMVAFALGNLERHQGRHRAARAHYRHALGLLGAAAPDAALPHAEGITARQLAALVHDLLATEAAA